MRLDPEARTVGPVFVRGVEDFHVEEDSAARPAHQTNRTWYGTIVGHALLQNRSMTSWNDQQAPVVLVHVVEVVHAVQPTELSQIRIFARVDSVPRDIDKPRLSERTAQDLLVIDEQMPPISNEIIDVERVFISEHLARVFSRTPLNVTYLQRGFLTVEFQQGIEVRGRDT